MTGRATFLPVGTMSPGTEASQIDDTAELLWRRLTQFADLSLDDRALLPGASAPTQDHEAGGELDRQGATPGLARLVLSGWACRARVLPDGRRQIFSVVLPGDCLGVGCGPQVAGRTLSATLALTRIRTVTLEPFAAALRETRPEHAALAAAYARIELMEQARLLDQVVSLGRRTAVERVAHLLLELRERLAAIGLAGPNGFPCPLTQEVIADLMGLSTVHVNRTLQQLRRENLLVLRSGRAELPDLRGLVAIADYQPVGVATGLRRASRV
jgi:CRP-like cAMP-binding protein